MVYTQKNKDLATMNKIRVNSDAPQGQAVPAPPIVPVVLFVFDTCRTYHNC